MRRQKHRRQKIRSDWDIILGEIAKRNEAGQSFYYTDFKPHTCQHREKKQWRHSMKTVTLEVRSGSSGVRYYLGDLYPDVYLTFREAQTALLLEGHKYREISQMMRLSCRTVEYYASNMKKKFCCHSKRELIYIIRESKLLVQLQEVLDVSDLLARKPKENV